MTGSMTYKNYSAVITFDETDSLFYGDVIGLNDTIVFSGSSVEQLRENFHDVVEAYLEACAEDNVDPERPYSGKIQLRMGPDVHRQLALEAAIHKVSLNEWILTCIRRGSELQDRKVEAPELEHAVS